MAAIVYLDVDDEITSAAARIRSGTEARVALVVPSGSRLATSRINFRLLAREAQTRDRRLSIVAGDAATRALAASAGLPVFGSVAEYEDALDAAPAVPAVIVESPPKPGPKARQKAAPAMAAAAPPSPPVIPARKDPDRPPVDLGATQVLTVPLLPPVTSRPPSTPVVDRLRLPALDRSNALVASGALGLALVVVAIGAWLLLPSASITVTAREEGIGPLNITIRADPTATVPDTDARVVPAQRLTFALTATDTFSATDKRVEQTAASGSVTFRSYNTGGPNTIPRGSVVSTEGGIQFQTRSAVTLAAARVSFPSRTVIPSSATVQVDGLTKGPGGNVLANTIRVVPPSENADLTTVINPEATSGGTRAEFPRIAQADVDAAIEQLTLQLGTDFDAILADPSRTPGGLTLFLETRSIAAPVPSIDPATLVGQELATFDLTLNSTGTVIAVDTTPVSTIAESRIRNDVAADHRLIESSVDIKIGEAIVQGESVSFPVTARAAQVRVLDEKALREQIKGRSIADARAILYE
ncbi:MAG: baseplate J/gp47 family protein, partial [Chloroflexota bacterium]|nr:baseplate J/gp47 family protein [Chloroflexota bacterium]